MREGLRARESILITMFLMSMVVSGCGTDGFVLAPVSGRVTIDGQPVAGVRISFEPIADEKRKYPGPESIAITGEDGSYKLYTTDEERRGAVVGKCRVKIWTIPGDQMNQNTVITDDQDPNYDSVAEIKALKAQIRASKKKNAAPVSLGIIPFRFNDRTELSFEVPSEGSDKADFAISWK